MAAAIASDKGAAAPSKTRGTESTGGHTAPQGAFDSQVADAPAIPYAAALMPRDPEATALLRQRAEQLAKKKEDDTGAEAAQFLRFRLGPSEWYGIPYRWLDEILYARGVVAVPGTPPYIAGVVNHRAELLTVLNLKHFFQTQDGGGRAGARIIVVRAEGLRVGLLVDAVTGNENYDPRALAPPISPNGVAKLDYIRGIHQGAVTLLDPGKMLKDPDLAVNTSAR